MFEPDPREWTVVTFWAFAVLVITLISLGLLTFQGCENPSCTKDFAPPAWCDNLIDEEQPDSDEPKFPWERPEEREPGDIPLNNGPGATCGSSGRPPCPNGNGSGSGDGAPGSGFECAEGEVHICWKDYDRCVRPQHPLSERNHQHVSTPPCTLGPHGGPESGHAVHEGACPR